jgi:hypothetical protein
VDEFREFRRIRDEVKDRRNWRDSNGVRRIEFRGRKNDAFEQKKKRPDVESTETALPGDYTRKARTLDENVDPLIRCNEAREVVAILRGIGGQPFFLAGKSGKAKFLALEVFVQRWPYEISFDDVERRGFGGNRVDCGHSGCVEEEESH